MKELLSAVVPTPPEVPDRLDQVRRRVRAGRQRRAALSVAAVLVIAAGAVAVPRFLSEEPVAAPPPSCPVGSPGSLHGAGTGPLVPEGATTMNVCIYQPPGTPGRPVYGPIPVREDVGFFADELNALPLAPPDRECPAISGPEFRLEFVYPDRPPAVVVIYKSCSLASNGGQERSGKLTGVLDRFVELRSPSRR